MKFTQFLLICLLLPIVLSIYIYGSSHRQTTLDVITKDNAAKYQLAIPLEIEDSTYYFIWDTGASKSDIDPNVVESLRIRNKSTKKRITVKGVYGEMTDSFNIEKVFCRLGEFHVNIPFRVMNAKHMELAELGDTYIKGVIGQDLIAKYNWLFDLRESKVTVSKRAIDIPDYDDLSGLSLSFSIPRRTPIIELELDSVGNNVPFTFDTGFFHKANLLMDSMKFLLYPSFSITNDLACNPILQNKALFKFSELFLYDSLKINNFQFHNISFANDNRYKKNYITASFIFQFEKMYYDSKNKEVKLINYRGDSHPTGDEKEVIRYMEE